MKSLDEAKAQARLGEILKDVDRQPVVIRRQGKDIAVVLSMAEYERLRLTAVREFLAVWNEVAAEASTSGLTETRLSKLLNSD